MFLAEQLILDQYYALLGRKIAHDFLAKVFDKGRGRLHSSNMKTVGGKTYQEGREGSGMLCREHAYLSWQPYEESQLRGFGDTIAANKCLPEAGS